MAITQRLEFRQSQSLVMTPQLMQAIKLLQLSNLDIAAFVEGELERNPLLERASEDAGPAARDENGSPRESEGSGADSGAGEMEAARDIAENLGTGLDNVFPDDAAASATPRPEREPAAYSEWGNTAAVSSDDYNLEAFVAAETTLRDHLSEQLGMSLADPASRMIGQYLIDLVDDAGYLPADLGDAAARLGAAPAAVEAVLAILQTFEPPGVCARNLSECLAIQLRERDRYDPAMQALIAHLDLVAKRDLAALRKLCGVDAEDLADMLGELRRLDPKPGLKFGSVAVQPVVPDVFVRPGPDGGWLVELNSDTLPKVLVNQGYYAELSRNVRKDGDKSYFAHCMQNATWLVRALDQRARTILKVATEIVRQQDAFFTHGVAHLRPLNLKAVADAIQMHESTVSRVTANKYMATNRGIFELKYFFTAAIAAADGGEAHSAEAVRHRIRQLIDAEAPDAILSDDVLVEQLRAAGIEIARRTVAKYREAMRIASSVQRRRDKQAGLGAGLSGRPLPRDDRAPDPAAV
ncbi:MAG: RNA polymerase sigma-54 factor [Xanthobacteraceae bacterium]|nr:MAG: RNA polymerase sigma-54 factor [Xanthobacteraceae bacterium]